MHCSRWRYRAWQFAKVRTGRLDQRERGEVAQFLVPPLLDLLLQTNGYAQRHGYDVYRTLLAEGWEDPELLAAALLHDVGKGHVGIFSRALWVVLGLRPGLRKKLARAPLLGQWLGLEVSLCHARLGAEMVAQKGGSAKMVRLIQEQELPGRQDPLLEALQRADDAN